MKDIVRRLGLFATTTAVVFAACKGPAGPPLTGTWSGFLHLYDEYGAPLGNDSGITVHLLGTSDTSTTGPAGAYAFNTVSVGVYSLQYVGNGYGTYVAANQQFVGGGTVNIPVVTLGRQSTGVITGLAMTPNAAGDTILATGTITAPPAGVSRYVRLFYGSSNNVVANPPPSWTVTGPVNGSPYAVSTAAFTIAITGQDLLALRSAFGTGKTVNAIAYGESYYENSYPGTNTGKPVFPNVSSTPSNVTTFVMP